MPRLASQGRQFWTCPNISARCDFFEVSSLRSFRLSSLVVLTGHAGWIQWSEGDTSGAGNAGAGPSRRGGSSRGSSSSRGGPGRGRGGTSSGGGGGGGQSILVALRPSEADQRLSSAPECFNCGQGTFLSLPGARSSQADSVLADGHWASDCPTLNGGGGNQRGGGNAEQIDWDNFDDAPAPQAGPSRGGARSGGGATGGQSSSRPRTQSCIELISALLQIASSATSVSLSFSLAPASSRCAP